MILVKDLVDPINFDTFKSKYQKVPVEQICYSSEDLNHKTPQVSVMIRTFNHADYIKQAVNSVLAQKVDFEYEILLGDDESNDGTREICIEYAKRYPNKIRLFLHKRENNIKIFDKITPSFMFGYNLFNCKGKFVALLCGDDYWTDENKLQKQWEFMRSNDEYSFCYHAFQRVLVQPDGSENPTELLANHFFTNTVLFKNIFEYLPNAMFETLNEDIFIYHLIKYSGKEKYIEEISPTIQRNQMKGIWFSKNDELFKTKFRILTAQKLLEAYRNTPIKENLSGGLLYQIVKGWETLKYTGGNEVKRPNVLKFWYFLYKNEVLFKYISGQK